MMILSGWQNPDTVGIRQILVDVCERTEYNFTESIRRPDCLPDLIFNRKSWEETR